MPRSAEVAIDMELMRRVEVLPVVRSGNPGLQPTPTQVEALRRYWRSGRRQIDVAKAIGVSAMTARRWYREYVEGSHGSD